MRGKAANELGGVAVILLQPMTYYIGDMYITYGARYLVKNTTVVELHATPLVNCISNSNALCDSRELYYIQGVPPIC